MNNLSSKARRAARVRGAAIGITAALTVLAIALPVSAMHIAEGILPPAWAALWYVVALPFCIRGFFVLKRRSKADPLFKPMVALVGAVVFVFSCMPVPVPTAGTCSHPVGTGLAAILIGPSLTVVVTAIALLLQALFLAHGGITTLGADIVSMGVAGGFVGYATYKLLRRLGGTTAVSAFAAGMLADWATYLTTSAELSLGLVGDGALWSVFATIVLAFVPTQLPLGIVEGIVSAGALKFVSQRRPELMGLMEEKVVTCAE